MRFELDGLVLLPFPRLSGAVPVHEESKTRSLTIRVPLPLLTALEGLSSSPPPLNPQPTHNPLPPPQLLIPPPNPSLSPRFRRHCLLEMPTGTGKTAPPLPHHLLPVRPPRAQQARVLHANGTRNGQRDGRAGGGARFREKCLAEGSTTASGDGKKLRKLRAPRWARMATPAAPAAAASSACACPPAATCACTSRCMEESDREVRQHAPCFVQNVVANTDRCSCGQRVQADDCIVGQAANEESQGA